MGTLLLRLHFHDRFVNGCDASVLLDDTANFTGEKTAGPNKNSLRGFNVINAIKAPVKSPCRVVVSSAAILVVAARDGVIVLGGQRWTVPWEEGTQPPASLTAANNRIPAPTLNLGGLINSFSSKGFATNGLVSLSGT
ncbi:cationic peroxidase 1 [Phtheirospermum japonicum]|uniref:peroxidase n=1 Tax=Phtheirospermum japonicum TaxID=374723 RepID=A0A830D7V6_9LAMI|nr:cationic peroxidase 1 [Phtheirospermum japonicum]